MKQWIRNNRGLLIFIVLLGITRTGLADWNHVPSGSMRPNILEGDLVFVNRIAFDLKVPLTNVIVMRTGRPQRGDIVTFDSLSDGVHMVKRIAGLPGDVVEMRGKVLAVNGRRASYDLIEVAAADGTLLLNESTEQEAHLIQWRPEAGTASDFGPVAIPEDHFLMLGDNRDNSRDSRYIGLVPRHLLSGRAERVLVSVDVTGNYLPRFERFGKRLN